tara:strand:- start:196 stop:465 length:270 start_codon:yes stop_codon:yes gene_type:complete
MLTGKEIQCKPPKWNDPINLEAYSWCINHGVKISAHATVPGFKCKTWVLVVTANEETITSPKEYGPDEVYEKMFELYRFYYNKYNKNEE